MLTLSVLGHEGIDSAVTLGVTGELPEIFCSQQEGQV